MCCGGKWNVKTPSLIFNLKVREKTNLEFRRVPHLLLIAGRMQLVLQLANLEFRFAEFLLQPVDGHLEKRLLHRRRL